jgi:hypothetical protein
LGLTLFKSSSISRAMASKVSSPERSGTASELEWAGGDLMPAPSLLKATSFKSISFSRWRACFRRSATEAAVDNLESGMLERWWSWG